MDLRDEWDAYDITTPTGVKIEVKSAAYIQSWGQKAFSKISFSIKKARFWDDESNRRIADARRSADIYIFCHLKHQDQKTIDPLKMEQWDFYVLPTIRLDNYTRSQHSITINSLRNLTEPVMYKDLKLEIEKASKVQNRV
ncbi:hypothetical protein ACVWYG_003944 [Pedobacter sp. UYEF25]